MSEHKPPAFRPPGHPCGRVEGVALQIRERRKAAAEMYMRGLTQQEIALALGCDKSLVCRDLQEVRRQWRESAMRDWDEAVGQQLEELERLREQYWEAWERSKQDRTRRRRRKRKAGESKDSVREVSTYVEQRDGNPKFLAGVMQCIERRCKLLGLDAPTRVDLDVNLTAQQRRDRLLGVLAALRDSPGVVPEVIDAGEVAALPEPGGG
jgi:predicted transcriptional regulator